MDQYSNRKETISDLKALVGALKLMTGFLDDTVQNRNIGDFRWSDDYRRGLGYAVRELSSARDYLNMTIECLQAGMPKETRC